jgi:hypothetical protein
MVWSHQDQCTEGAPVAASSELTQAAVSGWQSILLSWMFRGRAAATAAAMPIFPPALGLAAGVIHRVGCRSPSQ